MTTRTPRATRPIRTVSWDQANARRTARQHLQHAARLTGRPAARDLTDVVGTMLGAHAQVMSAAEVSVGIRLAGVNRQQVRAALWEARTLVKTYGPRGTIHLLPAAELPFWAAALPAIPHRNPFPPDRRLTDVQAEQVVAAVGDALDGAELTIDELSEQVVARTGPWAGDLVMPAFQGMWPRWRQVMHRAGQSGALCFAPNRGRKVTYTRPPHHTPLPASTALAVFVRRYLHAYGPATPRHFAKWAAAPAGWTAELFASLASAGEIEPVLFDPVPSGETAWVVADDTDFSAEPVRGVRLLPYFDAYGIASHPRERLFPGRAYERALAGGQAGNFPVLLVDGAVAGVWHQRRRGRRTTVTVETLSPLTAKATGLLEEQVTRVGEILEAVPDLVVGPVTAGPHA